MATRTVVIQICDNCGTEEAEVEPREVSVGKRTYAGEVCPACWQSVENVLSQMRRVRQVRKAS